MFIVLQYVAKGMVERKEGGAIVNVSSLSGLRALPQHAVYCECTSYVCWIHFI